MVFFSFITILIEYIFTKSTLIYLVRSHNQTMHSLPFELLSLLDHLKIAIGMVNSMHWFTNSYLHISIMFLNCKVECQTVYYLNQKF